MTVSKEEFIVWAGPKPPQLLHEGKIVTPPHGWMMVPSGDAGLTRRLKTTGDYWLMVHRRRNRIEATGVWLDATVAAAVREQLTAERSAPAYRKKLADSRRYRAAKQEQYTTEFRRAILVFLAFAPRWNAMAEQRADAVTRHAVPVGSGTVARTRRIPVERRAEAAVIAWMRHQTTAYDQMSIASVKGERREVRRKLAERSRQLLQQYRTGTEVDADRCPLARALQQRP
ncbi:MAG: DUF2293 domain-containing protein [Victivallales bacterium]|nr:DUF2293 domain-containing protein [Victivallales bacterium]